MELRQGLSVFATFCYAAAVYLVSTDRWIYAGIAICLGTCLMALHQRQKKESENDAA